LSKVAWAPGRRIVFWVWVASSAIRPLQPADSATADRGTSAGIETGALDGLRRIHL
jgi:hypothetical protein